MQVSQDQQRNLLDLVRSVILRALRGEPPLDPPPGPDPLLQLTAGCFVTLHDAATHRLRGCIGRLQTPDPLHKTICETSRSVLEDPRFRGNPVTLEELPRLELEVSILSPLRPAADPLAFEPMEDGIYLIVGGRAGTFLPQVARETGWTREQLLARLCTEKMGLPADAWKSPGAKLLTYQAVVIGPVPFGHVTTPAAAPAGGALQQGDTIWIL